MSRWHVARFLSVCALGGWTAAVGAGTLQNFDAPGTPYELGQHFAGCEAALLPGPSGNFLRLATDPPICHNSIAFERSDTGAHCEVTTDFDFRLQPVTGRADGLAFALLDTAVHGGKGVVAPGPPYFAAEEPNFARSLGIGFDIYQNPQDPNNNHVSIHYDNQTLTTVVPPGIDLASGGWLHARVELRARRQPAKLTLTLTPPGGSPTNVVSGLVIPGLRPFEARVHFAARSGGESAHHDLDNVAVTFAGCPGVLGAWDTEVMDLNVVAIHAHLLPTGKVLYWDRHDYGPPGNGLPRLWDPETGNVTLAGDPGYDIFCAGHSFLGDGRLLVTGGHVFDNEGEDKTSTYDPLTGLWARHEDMNAGRWYPTTTTLAGGGAVTVSGSYWDGTLNPDGSHHIVNNATPQVFDPASGMQFDVKDALLAQPLYPMMFLAPDGRVFDAGPQPETRFLDTSGSGSWSPLSTRPGGFRDYGSAVTYAPGSVLVSGGSPADLGFTRDTAEVIDLATPSPSWRAVAPMAYARRQHNLTLLPDGSVLATGGTSAPGFNNPAGAVFAAEKWEPVTETWATLAGMRTARLYHSIALLLPDGRVLVAGGGHPHGEPGDTDHPDAEIYRPAYLFQRGARPTITAAPATVAYGETFFVGTPDAATVSDVAWVRLSAVTHSFNQNQRLIRPTFAAVSEGLQVTAPTQPAQCPPGHYLMFILRNGVPSVARIVHIG